MPKDPATVIGSMTAEYMCPFPRCPFHLTAHPHEFDSAIQPHLDAEHGGVTAAQLRDEVSRAQGLCP